jgi:hypothetical protein
MPQFLKIQNYLVILLVFGTILVLVSYFEGIDVSKLQTIKAANPIYPLCILGIFLIVCSIFLYSVEKNFTDHFFGNSTFRWLTLGKVEKVKNGFSSIINSSAINIIFGRIDTIESDVDTSLIVLPSNEFFDDECINDKRSALGAFIQAKYPDQTKQVQCLIKKKLVNLPSQDVEKEIGIFQKSFGVGTCIFLDLALDKSLSSQQKILFLSVTTKRAGEGLRAEISHIFTAVNKIQEIVADKRLSSVYIPLIGSGHGGLKKEAALFGMLLAVCDALNRPFSNNIESFNIIVFQASEKDKPDVSPEIAKRLLKTTTGMFF